MADTLTNTDDQLSSYWITLTCVFCAFEGCTKSKAVFAIPSACRQDWSFGWVCCQRISTSTVHTEGNVSYYTAAVR